MKKRNRVIYQSESIHVSNDIDGSLVSDHDELVRIQDAAYGFTMNRTDVSQYGLAARIDAIHLDMPTVNFDLSYYLLQLIYVYLLRQVEYTTELLLFLVQHAFSLMAK